MDYILIFLSTFVADVAWVFYIRKVEQGKAFAAGAWGGSLYIVLGYVVITYVSNHWMLIPAFIGSFLGSYFTVKYDKRKEKI